MHILFGDDSVEARDLYRVCFSLAGHTCETAHDGFEVLRILTENRSVFDVVVMDYHMPGMNGLEVAQQIRQMADFPPVPLILFTGDVNACLESEAQQCGIDRVVYKPIASSRLVTVAQEVAVARTAVAR